MKVRTDYVTNSSSSSFIIAYREFPQFDEETLAKYPCLKGYTNILRRIFMTARGSEETRCELFADKQEWDKYFVENFGRDETVEEICKEDEYSQMVYNDVTRYLNEDFNIACLEVDYDDTFCYEMIRSLRNTENFIVIVDGE